MYIYTLYAGMLHAMLCMPVDAVGMLHLVHILRCPRGVIGIVVTPNKEFK